MKMFPRNNQIPLQEPIIIKPKTGILKTPTKVSPSTVESEIIEIEKPVIKKREKTNIMSSSINKRVANKIFKVSEVNAQILDADLLKSNIENKAQSSHHTQQQLNTIKLINADSARLTYLKRYVANGLAGKNNAKFLNGYWNRLPFKTKSANAYENETTTIRSVVEPENNLQNPRPPKSAASHQHQQHQQNQQFNSNLCNNPPSLTKEVSIIDLHLPPNIQTQPKTPVSYYKRNLLIYLNKNNNNNIHNSNTNVSSEITSKSSLSANTNSASQKSVKFNDKVSVESYQVDNTPSQIQVAQFSRQHTTLDSFHDQIIQANLSNNLFDKSHKYIQPSRFKNGNRDFEINGKRFYFWTQENQKNFLSNQNTSIMANGGLLRRSKYD
jgi:YHS domain-containing protein